MRILLPLLVLYSSSIDGQICSQPRLGLSIQFCQKCGSPGLDDFCIKRYGKCGTYTVAVGNTGYGNLGGPAGLPPHGYYSGFTNGLPSSCAELVRVASAIPNSALQTSSFTVYSQTGDWGASLPRVFFNPLVAQFLNVQYPLHHCLENNAGFPNKVWNYANPYKPNLNNLRLDSFYFNANGNNTWSYQCYCDYCSRCQQCTNG
ncbi:unnamed protein product [Lymnaea stagnalis]|uniref:Uncharacterized protein n=1 Tax=Lymnaea stagnalis TaxID=6523 RepID=A0AAV2I5T9_LYMST